MEPKEPKTDAGQQLDDVDRAGTPELERPTGTPLEEGTQELGPLRAGEARARFYAENTVDGRVDPIAVAQREEAAREKSEAKHNAARVTVGRIVHFYTDHAHPLAALVTAVYSDEHDGLIDAVDLCVFPPVRLPHFNGRSRLTEERVLFSARPVVGCWTWPPRV